MPTSKKSNKVITDLEIEKRLDKLSQKAVYDQQNKKEEKMISDKRPKRISLYLDPSMLDMRDTALEKKLDTISNNSILTNGNDIPVRDNEIVPYNVVDNYIQEEKLGDKNLLATSYIPDLEALPDDPFQNKAINDVLQDFYNKRQPLLQNIQLINDKISKLQEQKRDADEIYNNKMNKIISTVNESRGRQFATSKATRQYEYEKKQIDAQIEQLRQDISQYDGDIERLRSDEADIEDIKQTYNAERLAVERRNKEKIKLMEQEFNDLNRGRYSVQQFEGESDDDYKTRMEQLGNTELLQQDADEEKLLYQSKIFKNNLKEIIRQPDIIESVLKNVKEDYDIEGLKYLNEVFPFIRTEFIKVFGKIRFKLVLKMLPCF